MSDFFDFEGILSNSEKLFYFFYNKTKKVLFQEKYAIYRYLSDVFGDEIIVIFHAFCILDKLKNLKLIQDEVFLFYKCEHISQNCNCSFSAQ